MGFRFMTADGKCLKIRAILAMDRDGVIGYDGDLIFQNKEDLQFFKTKTMGHTVVMGWKTFESMNYKVLPGRQTVIITHHPKGHAKLEIMAKLKLPKETPVPILTNDINDIIHVAEERNDVNVYIAGGASIYNLFAPYTATWVVTLYNTNVQYTGVDNGLLPKDYNRHKLIRVRDPVFILRNQCMVLDTGEFETPNGHKIPYVIRAYQKLLIRRPMSQCNLIEEESHAPKGIPEETFFGPGGMD